MPSAKYSFFKSSCQDTPEIQPVLFYHLPKCGGMSIYAAASAAIQAAYHAKGLSHPSIDRCDDIISETNLRNTPYAFIATHLPYGLHNRLKGAPMLMTVLRDPIHRVRSACGYHCARTGRELGPSEISAFITDPSNSNLMTKLLSGKTARAEVTEANLHDVINRLFNEFDFVATTAGIQKICEAFLQHFGLPNVITTRINPTPEEFKIDMNSVTEEIRRVNTLDLKLFDRLLKHTPLLPKGRDLDKKFPLNPLTMLITECGDREASHWWGTLIETEKLLSDGLIEKNGRPNNDAIDHFLESVRA